MPALNFKREFEAAILDGDKTQTVRKPRRDGRPPARRGDRLKIYTGMRTKSCRLIETVTVTSVDTVRIEATQMWVNGRLLPAAIYSRDSEQTDNEFAEADGFGSFMEMSKWFEETHGLPFDGVVIRWAL